MTSGTNDWYRAACGCMVRCTEADNHRNEYGGCRKVERQLTDAAIKRAGERLRELSDGLRG